MAAARSTRVPACTYYAQTRLGDPSIGALRVLPGGAVPRTLPPPAAPQNRHRPLRQAILKLLHVHEIEYVCKLISTRAGNQ
jgi:hypothetical protein